MGFVAVSKLLPFYVHCSVTDNLHTFKCTSLNAGFLLYLDDLGVNFDISK